MCSKYCFLKRYRLGVRQLHTTVLGRNALLTFTGPFVNSERSPRFHVADTMERPHGLEPVQWVGVL